MFGSPEGSKYPASAFGILPGGHGSPDTVRREVHVFIANERRPIDWRAMIVASDRSRVHEVNSALLACRDHQFLTFVVKNGRRDLHIEVPFPQPRGVRR